MSLVLALGAILLMPFAVAGLGLIHAGLGRSRSAAHALLATMCALAVAAIVFVMVGEAWAGFAGGASHTFMLVGARWDWLGAEPLLARGVRFDGGGGAAGASALTANLAKGTVLCFEMFAVGIAAVIPVGAGADRWRLTAMMASSALLAGITWPLFAHWVWGGGLLAKLGAGAGVGFGLGAGFVDGGGSGTIQAVGGLTALAVAWILGARKGKYAGDGVATAIPGHNIGLVLAGCLVALVGWLGVNAAGAMLFYGVGPVRLPGIVVNTTLGAAAAALTALGVTRLRFGKPDASLIANGWVAGLAAGSAGCAFVAPGAAVAIGVVAGVLVVFAVEFFELKLLLDDPGGTISVHGVAGIWGVMAVGLFAGTVPGTRGAQVLAQAVGVAMLVGLVLPLTFALNWALDRVTPQRVDRDGEWQGMDVRELGAGAYPEFVVHSDEFVPR
jgi:ammonium transporter, Amt family